MPNRNPGPYDSRNHAARRPSAGNHPRRRPSAGHLPSERRTAGQLAAAKRRRQTIRRRMMKRAFGFVVLMLVVITLFVYMWSQRDAFADKLVSLTSIFDKDSESGGKDHRLNETDPDDKNVNGIETTAKDPNEALSPYAKDGIDFRLEAKTPYFVDDQRAIVLIDPGHGGMDGGAPGNLHDGTRMIESQIVIDIAHKLQSDLKERNIEAYLIRDDDTFISLYARVARASSLALDYMNAYQPDLVSDRSFVERMQTALLTPIEINSDNPVSGGFGFMQGYGMSIDQIRLLDMQQDCLNIIFVSLHCNAHKTNETLHGMQAYYCHDDYVAEDEAGGLAAQTTPSGYQVYTGRDNQRNQDLAQSVYDGAIAQLPQFGDTNAGKPVLAGNYAVLREHGLAGTLIEIGYMSNPDDLSMLIDQQTQEKLAEGIGSGIEEYFSAIFQ